MTGLTLYLAVVGAPVVHGPVLARDLLKPLKRPLDGGRTWRGRRLLGDNKTWRGALMMTLGPLLATLVLWQWPAWHDGLPAGARAAGPVACGLLVGLGVVLGELPNSLAKRQLGIASGTQRRGAVGAAFVVLDQGDLVVGVWICLLPVAALPIATVIVAFCAVSAIHLLVNLVGYAIGARSAPI